MVRLGGAVSLKTKLFSVRRALDSAFSSSDLCLLLCVCVPRVEINTVPHKIPSPTAAMTFGKTKRERKSQKERIKAKEREPCAASTQIL